MMQNKRHGRAPLQARAHGMLSSSSQAQPMQNSPHSSEHLLELAHAVLAWNRKYLHKDSLLSSEALAECFAPQFIVEPNGRRYEANHQNYQAFLEGMKQSMLAIHYDVRQAVAQGNSVMLAMRVQIDRSSEDKEYFHAMLWMQFDALGKVSLWHEVYVQQPAPASLPVQQ